MNVTELWLANLRNGAHSPLQSNRVADPDAAVVAPLADTDLKLILPTADEPSLQAYDLRPVATHLTAACSRHPTKHLSL